MDKDQLFQYLKVLIAYLPTKDGGNWSVEDATVTDQDGNLIIKFLK